LLEESQLLQRLDHRSMTSASRLVFISALLLIALVCTGLGFWQMSRLKERRAANAIASAARAAPILMLPVDPDSSWSNRRVRVYGRYDHAHDIVLRGRAYRGVPGVQIVSVLLPERGTTAVLVNRGFVPTPDATTVMSDSLREPGTMWVEGIALPIGAGPGDPLRHRGLTTWARLDLEALRRILPYPIYPFYLQQLPDSALPTFPRRNDPPALDDGPHLFYAIQWFGFAAIAIGFGVVAARKGFG
jgi:surfeit locus 1 family protein